MKNAIAISIEKKITFVVAGIEVDNLKVAQFFKRALTLHLQDLDPINGINEEHEARMLLNLWKCHMHAEYTDLDVVEVVMSMQLPKPARKEKYTAPKGFNFDLIPEDDNPPN